MTISKSVSIILFFQLLLLRRLRKSNHNGFQKVPTEIRINSDKIIFSIILKASRLRKYVLHTKAEKLAFKYKT